MSKGKCCRKLLNNNVLLGEQADLWSGLQATRLGQHGQQERGDDLLLTAPVAGAFV